MKRLQSRQNRAAFSLVLCTMLLVSILAAEPYTAAAYDLDYLQTDKWESNANVVRIPLHTENVDGTLDGEFRYYADSENFCIYTYFCVDGPALRTENPDVRVIYTFKTTHEVYQVELNGDGMIAQLHPEEARIFNAGAAFDNSSRTFLSAAQYLGKEDYAVVDIDFCTGHRYIVMEDLVLDRTVYKTTTQKDTTTKVATTAKRSTTGKSGAATTAKRKFVPSGRYLTTTEAATQFEPSGLTQAAPKNPEKTATSGTQGSIQQSGLPQKGALSPSSKAGIAGAAVLGVSGIALLLGAAVTKNKIKAKATDTTDDEEESS